jgi:beta-phosphoglucomutase-like phosphatase (HAD superfamily)
MAPRPVRAALFDMDGTLLDIEPLSTLAINQPCAPALAEASLAALT